MQVYIFKISLIERNVELWRELEVLSNATVANLAYCVLASVDASGSHLFNIDYNNNRFEFIYDEMEDFAPAVCYNPSLYTLDELNLNLNDELKMEYDYGASWEFNIKLISVNEMKKGTHRHYPYITKGVGRKLDEEEYFENLTDEDKKEINIKHYNVLFKDDVWRMQEGYEQHIINTKKTDLANYDMSNYNYETNERDWKLFKSKLPYWQERYIESVINEYQNLLNKSIPASRKFWELDKLIKKDKKKSGVIVCNLSRSNMINEIFELLKEKAITMDDLNDFSRELKNYIKLLQNKLG